MAPSPSADAYGGAGQFEMGLTWTLAILATLIVSARAYVSLRMYEKPGWDMFWAAMTYAWCLAAQILQTLAAAYGIGNHQDQLSASDLREGNKWNWIGKIVNIVAATLGKNIVIALLLRIQGNTHRRKAWVLHFVWMSNTILGIALIVVLCARCRPIQLLWNKSLEGTCNAIDPDTSMILGFFQGSWMAASDVVLAIYPVFIFGGLNMSWQRRAGLCALMGGGLIAGVCGALKTVQVVQAYRSEDVSYNLYPLLITSVVESWMILNLASIPPLRFLFASAFRKAKSTITRTADTEQRSSKGATVHGAVELTAVKKPAGKRVEAWARASKGMTDLDNESEEEILPQQSNRISRPHEGSHPRDSQVENDRGIIVTRDYDVSYA